MTEANGHKKIPTNLDNAATAAEPVVSKPYVMPDDPEEGSVEALTRDVAEAPDKVLRTLAEMENLRRRTSRGSGGRTQLRHLVVCARRARYCGQSAARAGRGSRGSHSAAAIPACRR